MTRILYNSPGTYLLAQVTSHGDCCAEFLCRPRGEHDPVPYSWSVMQVGALYNEGHGVKTTELYPWTVVSTFKERTADIRPELENHLRLVVGDEIKVKWIVLSVM